MTDVRYIPADLDRTERFLDLPQVRERVPKSTATIYRWMSRGLFPRQVQIGPNSVAWLESEVVAWINQKQKTAA